MQRGLKRFFVIFVAVILIASVGFVLWASAAAPASLRALDEGRTTSQVYVESVNGWQVFRPTQGQPTAGLIFYPGGRVSFQAYAPLLRPLAEKGYLVVVPPMPLNLAIFGLNAASEVIATYPQIKHWAVGGHSLGGSMAASYARANPGKIEGLLLWASYPAGSDDLSGSGLKVSSIYASNDGLATPAKVEASRPLLPPTTRWVLIEGGNHAGFGSYGTQSGDGAATISPETQWEQVSAASLSLLKSLED